MQHIRQYTCSFAALLYQGYLYTVVSFIGNREKITLCVQKESRD